jgi:hypothetical protein
MERSELASRADYHLEKVRKCKAALGVLRRVRVFVYLTICAFACTGAYCIFTGTLRSGIICAAVILAAALAAIKTYEDKLQAKISHSIYIISSARKYSDMDSDMSESYPDTECDFIYHERLCFNAPGLTALHAAENSASRTGGSYQLYMKRYPEPYMEPYMEPYTKPYSERYPESYTESYPEYCKKFIRQASPAAADNGNGYAKSNAIKFLLM